MENLTIRQENSYRKHCDYIQLKRREETYELTNNVKGPVGWGCRIHWLYLCRGVRPPPQRVSWYDTKQSDGEVPAVLEI